MTRIITPDAWFKIEIQHACRKCDTPCGLPTITVPVHSIEYIQELITTAIAEEREACAKIVEGSVIVRDDKCKATYSNQYGSYTCDSVYGHEGFHKTSGAEWAGSPHGVTRKEMAEWIRARKP
jgi:hypothetical protein